jgi:hypothetical protein
MGWAGQVARMGEKRNAYRILVGKPERKRPLVRTRRRFVDNVKIDLVDRGWGGVDWIGLAQDRDKWRVLVNVIMNFGGRSVGIVRSRTQTMEFVCLFLFVIMNLRIP